MTFAALDAGQGKGRLFKKKKNQSTKCTTLDARATH
jgi:hypothetical protein